MHNRLKTLALALVCTACLPCIMLSGCVNPELPVDDVVTDPPEDPTPPDEPGPAPEVPDEPPADPVLIESATLVDFQSAVSGIAAAAFDGSGFAPEPKPGQLDADAFRILGFSDGDLEFGDGASTGDFARGTSSGGVSTGGLYAFTVEEGNQALGVQPTSTDFAPGAIALRVTFPADAIEECRVTYSLWVRNDQGRSTAWSASWSLDDETWHQLPHTAFASPAEADAVPGWSTHEFAATIGGEELAPATEGLVAGEPFYLRWDATDAGGNGSRDECAVDDISVVFVYPE